MQPHDPPLLGILNKFKLVEMIMKVIIAAVADIPITQYKVFLDDRFSKSLPSESIIMFIMSFLLINRFLVRNK